MTKKEDILKVEDVVPPCFEQFEKALAEVFIEIATQIDAKQKWDESLRHELVISFMFEKLQHGFIKKFLKSFVYFYKKHKQDNYLPPFLGKIKGIDCVLQEVLDYAKSLSGICK